MPCGKALSSAANNNAAYVCIMLQILNVAAQLSEDFDCEGVELVWAVQRKPAQTPLIFPNHQITHDYLRVVA
jgi:hypothetical protein